MRLQFDWILYIALVRCMLCLCRKQIAVLCQGLQSTIIQLKCVFHVLFGQGVARGQYFTCFEGCC